MGPTIFVSHSAKPRLVPGDDRLEYARRVLDLIEAGLTKAGFNPWVDRSRLHPGDPWPAEINRQLHTCSGAVVLLDPVVLEDSDWVLAEATVLAHRYLVSPGFRLIPVLLSGARPQALQRGQWAPLRLSDIQPARDNPSAVLQDQTRQAGDVAKQVVDAFAGLAPLEISPLLEWWLGELTALLGQIRNKCYEKRLRDAARSLGLDPGEWEAQGGRLDHLAYAILDGDLATIPQAVRDLAPLNDPVPDDMAEPLSRKVIPLWVRLEMVRGLIRGFRAEPAARRMLIAVSDSEIALDILRRAAYCSPSLRLIPVSGEGGEKLNQLETTCRESIADRLSLFDLEGNEAPEVIAEALAKADPPPCMVIPANGLNEDDMIDLADRLGRRFPGVFLVFLAPHPEGVRGLPLMEPPLTEAEAKSARLFRRKILELTGPMSLGTKPASQPAAGGV